MSRRAWRDPVKLTPELCRRVLNYLRDPEVNQKQAAIRFGISATTVSRIARGLHEVQQQPGAEPPNRDP